MQDEFELGPNVESAMADVEPLDERGLMSLSRARAMVEAASEFDRDHADELWAALLSLEDGAEASKVAMRWRWRHMPRGRDNVAPVERYGAGILPWLRSRVVDGVLVNAPWCIVPCLLELDGIEVLELLWGLRGVRDHVDMRAWEVIDDGEAQGDPELEALAADELIDRWASRTRISRSHGWSRARTRTRARSSSSPREPSSVAPGSCTRSPVTLVSRGLSSCSSVTAGRAR